MRHILALPDYTQVGVIHSLTDLGIKPLHDAMKESGLDLEELPPSCVIGIPGPVLSRNGDPEFVLTQVARVAEQKVVVTSADAGQDRSGRTVFITEIVVGESRDDERSISSTPEQLCFLYQGIDEEVIEQVLLMRRRSERDRALLLRMMDRHKNWVHVASSSMDGMHNLPDWPKKKGSWPLLLTSALLILGLVMLLSALKHS